MKDLIEKILRTYYKIPLNIFKKANKKYRDFLMRNCCLAMSDDEYNIGYYLRPVSINSFPINTLFSSNDFAIILQGPIDQHNDFTLNTIKYYKKICPGSTIVLSTWEDEDDKAIELISKNGVDVILNKKPSMPGNLNVNMQLTTSLGGVVAVKKRNINIAIKTRTDQRIMKNGAFQEAVNLVNTIPLFKEDNINLSHRLCLASINYGNLFTPYFMSDFFYCGYTDDLLTLFSVDLDTRAPFFMSEEATKHDYAVKQFPPEIFILSKFLEKIGHKCDYTIKDFWDVCKNLLICTDYKSLQINWDKYVEANSMSYFWGDYAFNDTSDSLRTYNMDFITWVNLVSGSLIYRKEYEDLAYKPFK